MSLIYLLLAPIVALFGQERTERARNQDRSAQGRAQERLRVHQRTQARREQDAAAIQARKAAEERARHDSPVTRTAASMIAEARARGASSVVVWAAAGSADLRRKAEAVLAAWLPNCLSVDVWRPGAPVSDAAAARLFGTFGSTPCLLVGVTRHADGTVENVAASSTASATAGLSVLGPRIDLDRLAHAAALRRSDDWDARTIDVMRAGGVPAPVLSAVGDAQARLRAHRNAERSLRDAGLASAADAILVRVPVHDSDRAAAIENAAAIVAVRVAIEVDRITRPAPLRTPAMLSGLAHELPRAELQRSVDSLVEIVESESHADLGAGADVALAADLVSRDRARAIMYRFGTSWARSQGAGATSRSWSELVPVFEQRATAADARAVGRFATALIRFDIPAGDRMLQLAAALGAREGT